MRQTVSIDHDNSSVYGFVNREGNYVVKPVFNQACSFSDGLAAVRMGKKWGYIDKTGNFVISPRFDTAADSFREGLAYVRWTQKGDGTLAENQEHNGVIDRSGKVIVENAANDFHCGLGSFNNGDRDQVKFGYVDMEGRVVIAPQFQETGEFGEDMAPVKLQGKYGYIDKTGRVVIKAAFSGAGTFSEGLASAALGDKSGYINHCGDFVIAPKFGVNCTMAGCRFENGLAAVQVSDKWGMIDRKGTMVVPAVFDMLPSCSFEGMRSGVVNGKSGFINGAGKLVVPCTYDDVGMFSEGLAVVKPDRNNIGYVDRTGQLVVPLFIQQDPFPDSQRSFREGLAASVRNGKWGYIDKRGQFVVEPRFSAALPFSEALAAVGVSATVAERR